MSNAVSMPAGTNEIDRLSLLPFMIWLGSTIMLVLTDAFGVATAFGSAGALAFWSGLVGVNITGWLAWRRWTPGNTMTLWQFVAGAVLLNGLLALEVPALSRLLGRTDATIGWRPFVYGLLVTLFVADLSSTFRISGCVAGKIDQALGDGVGRFLRVGVLS